MFNANMNSIQLRMFSVKVLHAEQINKIITDAYIKDSPETAAVFMKNNGVVGNTIPFFTKDKAYPVLGYNGKSTVQQQQTDILPPAGGPINLTYNEQEYLLIPDDYGFIRLIQRNDLILESYEHVDEVNWDSKLVKNEDSKI